MQRALNANIYISILQHVKSKVVICEEEGGLMEPHIICALFPDMDRAFHLDRPSPATSSFSLVRSSRNRQIGFPKADNRIHALRSRTQHGIHLIGNIATYWNLSMWQKVIGMLHGREQVGSSWKLCCPRHAGPVIQVKQPDEFALYSPEGRCREACSDRLPGCIIDARRGIIPKLCTKPSDANSPASVNSRTVAIYIRSQLVDKAAVEDTRL